MAWGTDSNPVRFGQGQDPSDVRALFLKVFGGEVLAAFDEATVMMDKHQVRSISQGKSAQFPKTWKATAEFHTAGKEMLGDNIETGEITITIDGLVVSHTAIYDLDEKIAHFDVTGEFSKELGLALAREFDKNVMRAVIQAARTSSDGPFPGGSVITDAALAADANGNFDGKAYIDAVIAANEALYEKDVPEEMPRWCLVPKKVFNAIKYAKDSNGQYLLIDRNFGSLSIEGKTQVIDIDGVKIFHNKRLPQSDDSADASVYPKYQADFSATKGVIWTPMAAATLKLIDPKMETERDARRQEDFMVASMAVGHGTLRPECAVELA